MLGLYSQQRLVHHGNETLLTCIAIMRNKFRGCVTFRDRVRPGDRQYVVFISLLAALQLCVWFKPNEQFFVDVIPAKFDITIDVLINNVFTHSLYAPLLTLPVLGGIFAYWGYAAALTATTVGGLIGTVLVAFAAPEYPALVMSEWAWGVHFAAIYVTSVTLFAALPLRLYLPAAAISSASALVANVVSAAVGAAMAKSGPSCEAQGHAMQATFYVPVVATSIAAVLWVAAWAADILPMANRLGWSWRNAMRTMQTASVWAWLAPAALTRALHTLAVELWPAMLRDRFSSECDQANNALINVALTGAAVAAVLLLPVVAPKHATALRLLYVLLLATAGASLMTASILAGTLPAGNAGSEAMITIALTVYNATAEAALALASARVAAAAALRVDCGSLTLRCITAAGTQAMLAQVVQVLAQIMFWPSGVWPVSSNPFGLQLGFRARVLGLGGAMFLAAVLAVAVTAAQHTLCGHAVARARAVDAGVKLAARTRGLRPASSPDRLSITSTASSMGVTGPVPGAAVAWPTSNRLASRDRRHSSGAEDPYATLQAPLLASSPHRGGTGAGKAAGQDRGGWASPSTPATSWQDAVRGSLGDQGNVLEDDEYEADDGMLPQSSFTFRQGLYHAVPSTSAAQSWQVYV